MKAVVDPGEGPGGPGAPPVFLNQTEARRADEFFFFETSPSPPYLRVWMTAPHLRLI